MMMGININCKDQDFVSQILNGIKTIETRNTDSLKPYVGKRVGIICTGKGKATLMGYMTISGKVLYDSVESFRKDYNKHMVADGSKYDIKDKKYGYIITDVVSINPTPIITKGIIARKIY